MDYSLFNWYNEQNLATSFTEVKTLKITIVGLFLPTPPIGNKPIRKMGVSHHFYCTLYPFWIVMVIKMFLHKSDLIPFIVELSPYISGTAVVSLRLKPVKKRICFHGISKHINRVVFLFYLEKLTTSKELVCTVRVNNHSIMALELTNILNGPASRFLQKSRTISTLLSSRPLS